MESRSSLPFLGFRRRTPHCVAMPRAVKALCRARALKRWSSLLTQTESRIGFKCGMRKRLGEANWKAFVKYAKVHCKEMFVRALTPKAGMLCCGGKIGGEACPKDIQINLQKVPLPDLAAMLPRMHMDHKHDVAHVCDVWSRALPAEPRTWDDGVCGTLVAHLLFGSEDHVLTDCTTRDIWYKQITVRCGNIRGEKQSAKDFCHDVSNAHYDHVLRVADIAWPVEDGSTTEEDF